MTNKKNLKCNTVLQLEEKYASDRHMAHLSMRENSISTKTMDKIVLYYNAQGYG